MAFSCVTSASVQGGEVIPVRIEVSIQRGLPLFTIVGYPDRRLGEARERVRLAFYNSGFKFPSGKVTVNLCPVELPKQGSGFDLGIALAILQAQGKVPTLPARHWVIGSLSLNGEVQAFSSLLPILLKARTLGSEGCIIPPITSLELSLVSDCPTYSVKSLSGLITALHQSFTFLKPVPTKSKLSSAKRANYLFDQIYGQPLAKRVLHIALAGGHSLFLTGSPGVGKTMLVRAGQELLPDLNQEEASELGYFYSLVGQKASSQNCPPLREPHPSSKLSMIVGGGNGLKPGELTLASKGILFLDEFPAFRREVREGFRQPLQDKKISLGRAGQGIIYPADCLIIAAQNLCPCGRLGMTGERCTCGPGEMAKYGRLISQPILDRFDLFMTLTNLNYQKWQKRGEKEYLSAAEVANSIQAVREVQLQRLGKGRLNADLTSHELEQFTCLDTESKEYLERAIRVYSLTGRSLDKVLRVARTIADIGGSDKLTMQHLQEATQYRRRADS